MRRALFAALLVGGLPTCNGAPANLTVEQGAVTADAVDVTLHWTTKDYDEVVPKDGALTVVVKDLVPTANVFDDDKNRKEVCRADAPVSSGTAVPGAKKLRFHVAMKCPALAANVTRDVVVTFVGKDGKSLTEGTSIQRAARPDKPPAGDPRVNLKKALVAIPEPRPLLADKPCPTNRIYGVDRKDRDALLYELLSWDDAARTLGVPGARPLCSNVLGDVNHELAQSRAIAAVLRMDTCVQPTTNAAKQSFTRGSATGVLAIVDLTDGNVLCYGRMTGKTSDVVKVPADTTDPDGWVRGNFAGSIKEAAFGKMHTLSKYLGIPAGQPDN